MSFARLALVFALSLPTCGGPSGDPGAAVVARVDGVAITAAELGAAGQVEAREAGVEGTPGTVDPRRVLDGLIEARLLSAAAERHGIRIGDEQVERAVAATRAEWPEGSFDQTLASEGIDPVALRQRIRERLAAQRLFVDEVIARVAITDDEVSAWLEAHAGELRAPARVHAAQIVVKTEAEANEVLAALKKGASFEELAKSRSLSPDGKSGGDLGWFAVDEMPPPFGEVCFGLKPGQISGVVSSSWGFHVFKLLGRREAQGPNPDRLRGEAERRLRLEKQAAMQQAFLARLRNAAQIEVDEAALQRQMGTL